jgi:hypothetical protein
MVATQLGDLPPLQVTQDTSKAVLKVVPTCRPPCAGPPAFPLAALVKDSGSAMLLRACRLRCVRGDRLPWTIEVGMVHVGSGGAMMLEGACSVEAGGRVMAAVSAQSAGSSLAIRGGGCTIGGGRDTAVSVADGARAVVEGATLLAPGEAGSRQSCAVAEGPGSQVVLKACALEVPGDGGVKTAAAVSPAKLAKALRDGLYAAVASSGGM